MILSFSKAIKSAVRIEDSEIRVAEKGDPRFTDTDLEVVKPKQCRCGTWISIYRLARGKKECHNCGSKSARLGQVDSEELSSRS